MNVGLSDQPTKRPRSPTQERQQLRPIGPPHQSEKTEGHTVQLRHNMSAWTPPPSYVPVSYQYTYIPPLYAPNQIWSMPPYPFGCHNIPLGGHPKHLYSIGWHLQYKERLSATQSGHHAQVQQDCRTTRPQRPTNPAGGLILTATKRATKEISSK
jgi:hypothetical protein